MHLAGEENMSSCAKREKKRPWRVCWTYRHDIAVDRVEDERVWKSLRVRQFADGDHTMALRNQSAPMRSNGDIM